MIQQSSYKAKLMDGIEEVRKQSLKIKDEAMQCMSRRTADIDKNVIFMKDDVTYIRESVDELPDWVIKKIVERVGQCQYSPIAKAGKGKSVFSMWLYLTKNVSVVSAVLKQSCHYRPEQPAPSPW